MFGFYGFDPNREDTVAAASPQISLDILDITHDSVAVSAAVTDVEAVDTTGFEYRLISGSEIFWQSKEAESPSLTFSATIDHLESGSNYAVRAYYTIGLAIYYSDAREFSTPEAPADSTISPTATTAPTHSPISSQFGLSGITGSGLYLLIILGVIAVALIGIAVGLFINIAKRNKQ